MENAVHAMEIQNKNRSHTSAFIKVGRNTPDKQRLVLLKPVVHFPFTYGVLRGLLFSYITKLYYRI